jgi:hypothetical protein
VADILGRELPDSLLEWPAALGSHLYDGLMTWWGAFNLHPPASGWDWLAILALCGFALMALAVVALKAIVFFTVAVAGLAFVAGSSVAGALTRGRNRRMALRSLRRVARLLGVAARLGTAEFLLALAAVVAFDAAALALRVAG